MPLYIYYILIAVFFLIAIVGTIMVGVSKENKKENSQYEQRTVGNLTRLTLFYAIAAIVAVVGLIVYVKMR